jgi:Mrp family chromosome partitioning ATPase
MQLILLDDTAYAAQRMDVLATYQPIHCQTIHEVAGSVPDLILLDETMSQEIANELVEWGLLVVILAERVTVRVRRKFSMVRDVVTVETVIAFIEDRFSAPAPTPPVGERASSETHKENEAAPLFHAETAATNAPTPTVERQPTPTVNPPLVLPPRQTSHLASNRGAKLVGFVPLRSNGGGAGKTGVAFNYAAYLAAGGKKVLAIDLDPTGPFKKIAEATQQLTTEHWCNLMKQQQGGAMTERAVIDNVERQTTYGFYMISSSSRRSMIEKDQFRWILAQTTPFFDLIVFDLPATWTETSVEMMRNADELFIFGLYDPVQYEEYKRTIDEDITNPLIVGATRDRLSIFLGRAYVGKNEEEERAEVKRQLDVPHVIFIPEDPLFLHYRNEHQAIVIERTKAISAKKLLPWLEAQRANFVHADTIPALYEPKATQGWAAKLFGTKPKRKAARN